MPIAEDLRLTASQFKMKRNPRKLKWTKAFRKAAGKELAVDSTIQFAARRNVPVRYDRDLVAKTLKAMERVTEIRSRRERVFYKKRMAGKRERELALATKLVKEQGHLLPRMRASEKRRLAEEQGIPLEEVDTTVPLKNQAKLFGKEKIRMRVKFQNDIADEDAMEEDDEEEATTVKSRSKLARKEKIRQRLTSQGDIVEESFMETVDGWGEEDEEDDVDAMDAD